MNKISSYEDFCALHKKYKSSIELRTKSYSIQNSVENKQCKREVLICGDTGCKSTGGDVLIPKLNQCIKEQGIEDLVSVTMTGCFGFCAKGPIVKIMPDNIFYVEVKEEDIDDIVTSHLLKGRIVERLLYEEPTIKQKVKRDNEMSFYKKQKRIALRNCGLINPEDIKESIGANGYMALAKVLTTFTPDDVIDLLIDSNLRGRGGAGFPLGKKWRFARQYENTEKYFLCNADEGDPGAFMDRSILEGDPHSIIEAMTIGGYAIGASTGYIYIRAEYPAAIKRLEIAINQAREYGLLGKNILNTDFSFDINLKYGAGAFVCGEETSLIHSIEGCRGEPTNKPPFPAESGLWGKPTCVNNVETLANVPAIINNGADWFKSIGTETSKGTKVFALAGKINNVGLVEVPMGTTLREIIYEIGGGIVNGGEFKAVQTGGPSGGCIPAKFLDTPIDYESLISIGSMMGSGGMIIMDNKNCMVDIAKYYLEFTVDESCGKCTPCRIGTKRLYEILDKISRGKGTEADLAELKELGTIIKDTALCGLGQTAPNPVLSNLTHFEDEYKAHVIDKKCFAGSCKHLVTFEITDKCIGCTKCARNCPVQCISGNLKEKHSIDTDKCIKCGSCYESCPIGAIIKK